MTESTMDALRALGWDEDLIQAALRVGAQVADQQFVGVGSGFEMATHNEQADNTIDLSSAPPAGSTTIRVG